MRLGPFNGDYDALAGLVERSWAENKDSSLKYTPEFLQSCFAYPGTSFDLAPTIYVNGRPVAFIAGFPRRVVWNGRPQNLMLSALLTSSPEAKGKGYGAWLWMDLAKRTRAAGYDGMISISLEGAPVNRIAEECSKRLAFPTARIYEVRYRSILLKNFAPAAPSGQTDIDLFLELAAKAAADAPLRRVWTREEAEWQCCGRTGAVFLACHHGNAHGVITGYVADTIGPNRSRVLSIEDFLWSDLGPDARAEFLKSFLARGAGEGAQIASVAITGQTDYETLKQLKFRNIVRQMNIYVTRWSNPAPERVDSMYLDVF
jgi:GNAT superfamily N-acetyltransferase